MFNCASAGLRFPIEVCVPLLAFVAAWGCKPPNVSVTVDWDNDEHLQRIENELGRQLLVVDCADNLPWRSIKESRVVRAMTATASDAALERMISRDDLPLVRIAAFEALRWKEPYRVFERAIRLLYATDHPANPLVYDTVFALKDSQPTESVLRQIDTGLDVSGVMDGNVAVVAGFIPDEVLDAWFHAKAEHDPNNRFVQFATSEVFSSRQGSSAPVSRQMKELLIRFQDKGGPAATNYFLHFDGPRDDDFRRRLIAFLGDENVKKEDVLIVTLTLCEIVRQLHEDEHLIVSEDRRNAIESVLNADRAK